MKGKTCTVETADILLRYFGLKLIAGEQKKKGQ
jgi:hypothetical protein